MRESFARRITVFLVLLLLFAVITNNSGPYHSAFAGVLDQVGLNGPSVAQADDSIVTTIVLTLDKARREHVGVFRAY